MGLGGGSEGNGNRRRHVSWPQESGERCPRARSHTSGTTRHGQRAQTRPRARSYYGAFVWSVAPVDQLREPA